MLAKAEKTKKLAKENLMWRPPNSRKFKFNADEAYQGCPDETKIGSVLRDNEVRILMQFSKSSN